MIALRAIPIVFRVIADKSLALLAVKDCLVFLVLIFKSMAGAALKDPSGNTVSAGSWAYVKYVPVSPAPFAFEYDEKFQKRLLRLPLFVLPYSFATGAAETGLIVWLAYIALFAPLTFDFLRIPEKNEQGLYPGDRRPATNEHILDCTGIREPAVSSILNGSIQFHRQDHHRQRSSGSARKVGDQSPGTTSSLKTSAQ